MTACVLFVDDDEGNLVVSEAVCKGEFPVITAPDAESALELMRTREIGVILTDQRMAGISGVELLEQVRKEFPDTVRVLVTAYADLPAAIDAINRGHVRRYLRKPWRAEELRAEIRDALEVYQMRRKLQHMEQTLSENDRIYSLGIVAAGIAHELRNPTGWLTTNLNVARQELREVEHKFAASEGASASPLRKQLHEIGETLDDASLALQRIVDIVRGVELSTKRSVVVDEAVDVAQIVRLTLKLVQAELKNAAQVELSLEPAPQIRGSSTKIGQVAMNLIVNAIQAFASRSREQNLITIELREDAGGALLKVSDNGPGIEPNQLAHIFEPFFTTRPGHGTGLGLAICRKIVNELGGRIEAANAPQGGATFAVWLPGV